MLRALVTEPTLTRLVGAVLDEVLQEELGESLDGVRAVWSRTGSLPEVDIVVALGDDDDAQEVDDG